MTYFGFLFQFLVLPIVVLGWLTWRDARRGLSLPERLRNWPAWLVLLGHIIVALLYTTPWDNYLVATRVWWYEPALVTGITLGWVPLEEYIFFVLQPVLSGLWLLYLARRLSFSDSVHANYPAARWLSTIGIGLVWLVAMGIVVTGWGPGTYLGLELAWALPPIMLQVAFGADILWRYRRLVLLALLPATIYLSLADLWAIRAGTWTINPDQSFNLYLAGYLPVEEFIFFLLTNTLLVFGMVLVLACESRERISGKIRNLGGSNCQAIDLSPASVDMP